MVFRPALRSSKAMFRSIASSSRVFLPLGFDHRRRIQFFRAQAETGGLDRLVHRFAKRRAIGQDGDQAGVGDADFGHLVDRGHSSSKIRGYNT